MVLLGLLARLQVLVCAEHGGDRLDILERVWERARVIASQPLRLLAALGDEPLEAVALGVAGLLGSRGATRSAHGGEIT